MHMGYQSTRNFMWVSKVWSISKFVSHEQQQTFSKNLFFIFIWLLSFMNSKLEFVLQHEHLLLSIGMCLLAFWHNMSSHSFHLNSPNWLWSQFVQICWFLRSISFSTNPLFFKDLERSKNKSSSWGLWLKWFVICFWTEV